MTKIPTYLTTGKAARAATQKKSNRLVEKGNECPQNEKGPFFKAITQPKLKYKNHPSSVKGREKAHQTPWRVGK